MSKHEKREQLFEQNITCPKCESKDLRAFIWTPAYGGALRNVSCRGCGEFFNVFWNKEQESVYFVSTDVAGALV